MEVKLNKLVFAYDGHFIKLPNKNIVSKGGFPSEVWERYLSISEELIVQARIFNGADNRASGVISNHENVSFKELPNLSSIKGALTKRNKCRQSIEDELKHSDLLVARLPSEIGLVAISVAKKLNKPYVVEVVGDAFEALFHLNSLFYKCYSFIFSYRNKQAIMGAAGAIYVTNYYLQRRYPCLGITGVASNVELDVSNVIEWNPRKGNVFGLIGTLEVAYKGVDVVIKAISLLKNRGVICQLRIIGEGKYKKNYQAMSKKYDVEELVFFDGGGKSKDEVYRWIDDLDFYIQPSKTEGLPRALIEAMSRKKVCIGSNVGGIPELLAEDYIFESKNWKSLSAKMESVINMDIQEYKNEAEVNYEKARMFDSRELDLKRACFWEEIHKSVAQ
ncbi:MULTISPECIES: glycosyltransferase [unclassified Pseudoalteromonas]|uniref:glycosyltransferase n=1 Tax=unclassified Pseudoalteromonas TaxID=194690 RepID=UPI001F278B75|nr:MULTISPECIES: glycosyltransferase [unclassified Pseudoalteromonas]MCF2825872.1 glycosyltransferase [Pseudoalteromonas sp. OF5H-5]MCF2834384.1 glycosyltransferase [Pseudoalteromonas sp. DL2-H6]MCF2927258.1 glycosyltransferase [Pseudoalteromonas sp. DL2-H1]